MTKKKSNMMGDFVKTGVTTMVGVGLIGATSGMANAMPAGTAKNLVGTTVGLQSVALMGPSIKLVKKSFGGKKGYL